MLKKITWLLFLFLIVGVIAGGSSVWAQEKEKKVKELIKEEVKKEKIKDMDFEDETAGEKELRKEKLLQQEKIERENLDDKTARDKKLRKEKLLLQEKIERMLKEKRIFEDKAAREKELRRIEDEIAALKSKLEAEEDSERRAAIKERLRFYIETRRYLLQMVVSPRMPEIQAEPLPERPELPVPQKHLRPEFGIAGGMFAAVPAVLGEVRFHEPFGLVATSVRLGGIYAQGEDSNSTLRKHGLICIDGIYRLNPPGTPGISSYVGLGANYNVYTSGRTSGATGAEAFYGIEGDSGSGKLYFEVGYGMLRTGFSPDYQGLNAILGFRG